MSDNQNNPSKNGGNKILIVIVILLFLVVLVLVAFIAFKMGKGDSTTDSSGSSNSRTIAESARVVLDEESAQNVMDEMRESVEEGMFECNMSMKWTFEEGTEQSKDAVVANSENNTHPIYFDVRLKDTDELIYSSPVIPVGEQLTNISLDKDLDPGEYKAVVMYSLLKDEESQEVTSQAGFVIKIVVKN